MKKKKNHYFNMEIVTKYSIGDQIWRIYNNRVVTEKVTGVFISIKETSIDITYTFNGSDVKYNEMEIFKTKDELINSL